ncbi:hypothetical protein NEHOM01_0782 [Nematocida homosporus]|uniref:uncharacterized protein n=1 Tax=Nematocida homosporus TaxID=1912981 RepID=UPI00221F9580|nr:uncharacterized protein NEHOM01_0782 [Nematocida homosporus]KAI5185367.1 hypothetical protein NEHOM01_0782 [Nematocida homosporus]
MAGVCLCYLDKNVINECLFCLFGTFIYQIGNYKGWNVIVGMFKLLVALAQLGLYAVSTCTAKIMQTTSVTSDEILRASQTNRLCMSFVNGSNAQNTLPAMAQSYNSGMLPQATTLDLSQIHMDYNPEHCPLFVDVVDNHIDHARIEIQVLNSLSTYNYLQNEINNNHGLDVTLGVCIPLNRIIQKSLLDKDSLIDLVPYTEVEIKSLAIREDMNCLELAFGALALSQWIHSKVAAAPWQPHIFQDGPIYGTLYFKKRYYRPDLANEIVNAADLSTVGQSPALATYRRMPLESFEASSIPQSTARLTISSIDLSTNQSINLVSDSIADTVQEAMAFVLACFEVVKSKNYRNALVNNLYDNFKPICTTFSIDSNLGCIATRSLEFSNQYKKLKEDKDFSSLLSGVRKIKTQKRKSSGAGSKTQGGLGGVGGVLGGAGQPGATSIPCTEEDFSSDAEEITFLNEFVLKRPGEMSRDAFAHRNLMSKYGPELMFTQKSQLVTDLSSLYNQSSNVTTTGSLCYHQESDTITKNQSVDKLLSYMDYLVSTIQSIRKFKPIQITKGEEQLKTKWIGAKTFQSSVRSILSNCPPPRVLVQSQSANLIPVLPEFREMSDDEEVTKGLDGVPRNHQQWADYTIAECNAVLIPALKYALSCNDPISTLTLGLYHYVVEVLIGQRHALYMCDQMKTELIYHLGVATDGIEGLNLDRAIEAIRDELRTTANICQEFRKVVLGEMLLEEREDTSSDEESKPVRKVSGRYVIVPSNKLNAEHLDQGFFSKRTRKTISYVSIGTSLLTLVGGIAYMTMI